ncbi:MAG: hypothetical protein WA843_02720 [Candidatus Saccharimonadales bacterium]
MTSPELINAVGIPSVLGAFIYIGIKLHTLEKLENDVENIIKPDLKDVRERFATLEGKAANLFVQNSPISLTNKGKNILEESGLKEYIDRDKALLHSGCGKERKMETPYDVQQSAFDFFDEHEFPNDIDNKLKTYAFNEGLSMDSVRRIGAIYFRDICLSEKGFEAADLDKPYKNNS